MTMHRMRVAAFYAIAAAVSVILAVGIAFFVVAQLLIGWLPDNTIASIAPDLEWPTHRLHDVAMSSIEIVLVVGVVLQLYRPQRRVAHLLQAVAFVAAFAAVELAVGEMTSPGGLTGTAIAVVLVALHPAGLRRFVPRQLDAVQLGVVALGAVPWILFATGQAGLAAESAPGDAHDAMQHWTRMAVLGVLAIVYPLIASTDLPGWRLAGWLASLPAIVFGLQSIMFPDQASAASLPWAVAAVAYGAAIIVATEWRVRRDGRGAPRGEIE